MPTVIPRIIGLIEIDAPSSGAGSDSALLELFDRLIGPASVDEEQARAETACAAGRLAQQEACPSSSSPEPLPASTSVIEANLPRLNAELRVETARLRRQIQELTPAS